MPPTPRRNPRAQPTHTAAQLSDLAAISAEDIEDARVAARAMGLGAFTDARPVTDAASTGEGERDVPI